MNNKDLWIDCGNKVWTAETTVWYEPSYLWGTKKLQTITLRIDGREGVYRVDRKSLVWESIDNGEGFETKAEAEKYADRWIGTCIEQGTATPHTASMRR
jgi:hypothetical protein